MLHFATRTLKLHRQAVSRQDGAIIFAPLTACRAIMKPTNTIFILSDGNRSYGATTFEQ